MTALKADIVRCASCGQNILVTEADLHIASANRDVLADDALARAIARHLMLDCEHRFVGHPAFGAESRWQRLVSAANLEVTLEIAWTIATWGMPFRLYNVPGFRNGIVGHSDWSLD